MKYIKKFNELNEYWFIGGEPDLSNPILKNNKSFMEELGLDITPNKPGDEPNKIF